MRELATVLYKLLLWIAGGAAFGSFMELSKDNWPAAGTFAGGTLSCLCASSIIYLLIQIERKLSPVTVVKAKPVTSPPSQKDAL